MATLRRSDLLTTAEAAALFRSNRTRWRTCAGRAPGPSFQSSAGAYLPARRPQGLERSSPPEVLIRPKALRARQGLLIVLVGLILAASLFTPKRPLLIWNASPSVPVGLYRIEAGPIHRAISCSSDRPLTSPSWPIGADICRNPPI